jgi:hypothetical protein
MKSETSREQQIKLSASSFVNALRGQRVPTLSGSFYGVLKASRDGEIVCIENVLVEERVVIEAGTFEKLIEFSNCTFSHLSIKGGSFLKRISFVNGTTGKLQISDGVFADQLTIAGDDTLFEEFSILSGSFTKIVINGGTFNNRFVINSGNFEAFEITNGSINCALRISNGLFDHFQITGGLFFKNLEITGGKFKRTLLEGGIHRGQIIINDGSFSGDFVVNGIELSKLYLKGGTFQNVSFTEGSINNVLVSGGSFDSLMISGGLFENFHLKGGIFKSIIFDGGQFKNMVDISGGGFQNTIRVSSGKFLILSIKNLVTNESFIINGGSIDQLDISDVALGSLDIHGGCTINTAYLRNGTYSSIEIKLIEGVIKELYTFDALTIDFGLRLSGAITELYLRSRVTSTGSIHMQSLLVDRLELVNVIMEGKLDVNVLGSNNSSLGYILIKNSDLGNAIFKETNFKSYESIQVINSRLHNITTIGGYFPSHLDIGSAQNKPSEPERSAEAYNQLTLAMQRQGNRDKEVEYYTSYLDWQRKAYWKEKKWSATASLYLHKISTEYGSSWIRGALGTFSVGLVFYFLFLLSLPEVSCCSLQNGWVNFSTNVGYFFAFLLPTHSIYFVEGTSLTPSSYIFDFLGRIATGFMIYQTIAAFRRYGKV